MFRNDCFDMVVNINEKEIILSNEKTKEDINNLSSNSVLQVIPNKKQSKFDKDKYTLLQINT